MQGGPFLHEILDWLPEWWHRHHRDNPLPTPSPAPLVGPNPPAMLDYLTAALPGLGTMLANGPDPTAPPQIKDSGVGICVIASDLHLCSLRSWNAGGSYVPSVADALAVYCPLTGYMLGDPSTDQGTDPSALIQYRLGQGATAPVSYPDGSMLVAAIPVDATNKAALQQALWMGVGLFSWAELPNAWESEEDGGDTWDAAGAPNPQSGHGFPEVSYDDDGMPIDTWGEVQPPIKLTYAGAAQYLVPGAGGGCFVLLDADCISKASGLAPSGFPLGQLEQYLQAAQTIQAARVNGHAGLLASGALELAALARKVGREEGAIKAWLQHGFSLDKGL